MSKENFFISTPIYYTNGIPHIGHAYSTLIADSIARYQKISGKKVKFSTGVDENSQKIVESAEKAGKDIQVYLDEMALEHKKVWDGLSIEYTDFIRTTESRHHKLVREVLQKSFDNGDIYQGEYSGKYCIGCEAFKKDDDLIEKDGTLVCPDHMREPEILHEKNYFFKLSKYQKALEDLYESQKDFVVPRDRFNEVIAFVKRGLEDFSISRETNSFGIPLPFDESQVSYVWYDALFNYVTVCQGQDADFWPANLHIVGKDIIRFHAIYWPAMLISAGYELPKNILTTGFFTVDGQKISKSLGNAIDPVEFSSEYSKDMLVLYLLSTFTIGQDGDFDREQAIKMYNAKLANNLGNLVNRVVVLSLKLQENPGELHNTIVPDTLDVPAYDAPTSANKDDFSQKDIYNFSSTAIESYNSLFDLALKSYDLKKSLDLSFEFLDALNKYADTTEPWKLIKDDEETAKKVLYTLAEGLRNVALNLYMYFPEKMSEFFSKLGLEHYKNLLETGELYSLRKKKEVFTIKEKGKPLFARFDI